MLFQFSYVGRAAHASRPPALTPFISGYLVSREPFGRAAVSNASEVLCVVAKTPAPKPTAPLLSFLKGKLAGAEVLEPSPSTLTVWCPTGWTTPQRYLWPTNGRTNEVGSAASGSAKGFSKIARPSQDSATRPQKKCVFALACASQRMRCAKRTCLVDEAIFCKGIRMSKRVLG